MHVHLTHAELDSMEVLHVQKSAYERSSFAGASHLLVEFSHLLMSMRWRRWSPTSHHVSVWVSCFRKQAHQIKMSKENTTLVATLFKKKLAKKITYEERHMPYLE
jgi:hypothetical protein